MDLFSKLQHALYRKPAGIPSFICRISEETSLCPETGHFVRDFLAFLCRHTNAVTVFTFQVATACLSWSALHIASSKLIPLRLGHQITFPNYNFYLKSLNQNSPALGSVGYPSQLSL